VVCNAGLQAGCLGFPDDARRHFHLGVAGRPSSGQPFAVAARLRGADRFVDMGRASRPKEKSFSQPRRGAIPEGSPLTQGTDHRR